MKDKDDYIIIGKILKPQGLNGELKIMPLTSFPERFNFLKQVYIQDTEFFVENVKHLNNGIILKLTGINNRDEAEKFRDKMIETLKSESKKKSEDEYFYYELEGMKIVSSENKEIGVVSEVLDMPANAVLEVKTRENKEILIPFVKDVVKKIDIKSNIIYIELIKGLAD
ncbi:16S rRNA processing protein RimM [Candidatus Dependentiae bacterium]|nr:16S rRNA processing protein RimM [Candidatus Dependentiae bacterium]